MAFTARSWPIMLDNGSKSLRSIGNENIFSSHVSASSQGKSFLSNEHNPQLLVLYVSY